MTGVEALAVGGEEGRRQRLAPRGVAGGDGEAADQVGVDSFGVLGAALGGADQVAEPQRRRARRARPALRALSSVAASTIASPTVARSPPCWFSARQSLIGVVAGQLHLAGAPSRARQVGLLRPRGRRPGSCSSCLPQPTSERARAGRRGRSRSRHASAAHPMERATRAQSLRSGRRRRRCGPWRCRRRGRAGASAPGSGSARGVVDLGSSGPTGKTSTHSASWNWGTGAWFQERWRWLPQPWPASPS